MHENPEIRIFGAVFNWGILHIEDALFRVILTNSDNKSKDCNEPGYQRRFWIDLKLSEKSIKENLSMLRSKRSAKNKHNLVSFAEAKDERGKLLEMFLEGLEVKDWFASASLKLKDAKKVLSMLNLLNY